MAGVDGVVGDVGEAQVVVAGVASEAVERVVDGDAAAFGDHALGLLDDDAARQGGGELGVELAVLDGVRFWRMAMVAMSARAWATTTSSSLSEPVSVRNRLRAPMI